MAMSSRPQEVDSRFRFGSLLAAGLVVATFLLIGVAVSAVLHSVTPKVFESSATVLIEPRTKRLLFGDRHSGDFLYRHDQLIVEDNILFKALTTYNLNELTTLRDLPPNDQIIHIQKNLDVQPSRETDNLYRLRFRSRDARDAQTVLATLVAVYEKHLVTKYDSPTHDTRELLLKMKEKFANELAAQNKEVEQIEKQIAAGPTDEDNQATLKELQENVERFQSQLDIASRQLAEFPKENPRGFNFSTLSPASRGVSIYPRLPVFLLVGGLGGALLGLFTAWLMISVFNNRN